MEQILKIGQEKESQPEKMVLSSIDQLRENQIEAGCSFDVKKYQEEIQDLSPEEINGVILACLSEKTLDQIFCSLNQDDYSQEDLKKIIQTDFPADFDLDILIVEIKKLKKSKNITCAKVFSFMTQNELGEKEKLEELPAELQKIIIKNKLFRIIKEIDRIDDCEYINDIALDIYDDNKMRLRYLDHFIDFVKGIKVEFGDKGFSDKTMKEVSVKEKALADFFAKEQSSLFLRAQQSFDPKFCDNEEVLLNSLEEKINTTSNQDYKQFYQDLKKHYQEKSEKIKRVEESIEPFLKFDDDFTGLDPHQLIAVDFMTQPREEGEKGKILGDSMGLGKTLSGIATCLHSGTKENFIVCPNSLMENWKEEVLSKTNIPENNIFVIKCDSDLEKLENIEKITSETDQPIFIIINNEKLSIAKYSEELTKAINERKTSQSLVVDEAHNFKTSCGYSKMSETLLSLDIDNKFLLTGTPIVNGGNDLYNYLNLLNPEKYPLDGEAQVKFRAKANTKNGIYEIYQDLKKYMLRRKIDDYNPTIKEIKENSKFENIEVELTGKIKEIYLKVVDVFRNKYKKAGKEGKKLSLREYTKVFYLLKKLESDPFLAVDKLENNSLFSYLSTEDVREIFNTINQTVLSGTLSSELLSPKIKETITMIKSLPKNEKVVIYACSPKTVKRISELLTQERIKNTFISGEVSDRNKIKERSSRVSEFNNPDSDLQVLVMNEVGGEGINLYNAQHLFKIDRKLEDAGDKQVDGRLIRRGQKNPVSVYNFHTKTPDELRSLDPEVTIRAIDAYIAEVILPIKEQSTDFLLEGLITQKELDALRKIAIAEKDVMIKLAETNLNTDY